MLLLCREHTARVMETVRAINTGRSSKRSTGKGPHHQSTSSPEGGAGVHSSAVLGESSGEGGTALVNSQAGKPFPGTVLKRLETAANMRPCLVGITEINTAFSRF